MLVHTTTKNEQTNVKKSKPSKESHEGSPTNDIIAGNYRLKRAERWENIPTVCSEVGEI